MMRSLSRNSMTLRAEVPGVGMLGVLIGIILGIIANTSLIYTGIDYDLMIRNRALCYRNQSVFRGAWNPESMLLFLSCY